MIRAAVLNTLRQIGAIPNTIPGPDRDDRSGALPPPGAPLQPTNDAREQWIVDQLRKVEGQ